MLTNRETWNQQRRQRTLSRTVWERAFPLLGICAVALIAGLYYLGSPITSEPHSATNVRLPSKCRAISLRVLQQVVRANERRDDALRLCGITRITGYVVDRQNRDIVLVGEAQPAGRPLYLDDFVVALRNSWRVYAESRGGVTYYSPAGCSIDPRPKNVQELKLLSDRLDQASEQRSLTERWRAIGGRPQDVRVMGIPRLTRFSRVMVDADYLMKKLADGSVSAGVSGFDSHTHMRMALIQEQLASGKPALSLGGLQTDRFWFTSGKTCFVEDQGVVVLENCPVVLLTERELLRGEGKLTGSGAPDPVAKRFADSFTNRYDEIAQQQPVYSDLEALFRFVALTRVMNSRRVEASSGLVLKYLLNDYLVTRADVPRELPGIASVQQVVCPAETSASGVSYWSLTCGGVSMDIEMKKSTVLRDSTGALEGLARRVIASRPGPGALHWDVSGR